ncbi:unnamed protein product [Cochlearia groenlandica]
MASRSQSYPSTSYRRGVTYENEDPVHTHFRDPEENFQFGHISTCYCGYNVVVQSSATTTNPGRLFYTCPSYNDGECHVWKWWDEALMDELTEVKRELAKHSGLEDQIGELASLHKTLKKSTSQMDELKNMTHTIFISFITFVVVVLAIYVLK